MDDLRDRLANRVQLTKDGHRAYLEAVEGAFGGDVDYAQLIKLYGEAPDAEKRYSPATCIGTKRRRVEGSPDPEAVSTSYVERNNLTMRMGMRRFTRLTNAFSKKLENHLHMLSLYFIHYNFCRVHGSLRASLAMAAGRVGHVAGHGVDRRADRCAGAKASAPGDLPPPADFKVTRRHVRRIDSASPAAIVRPALPRWAAARVLPPARAR